MTNALYGVAASGTQTAAETSKATSSSSSLGKDDFLKLLVAQLTHQDPLEPLKDQEFIAQMAQFSSLEQQTNMAKGIETLAKLSMTSAVGYVGRTVGYTGDDGSPKAGMVKYVEFTDGQVVLKLEDGTSLSLDKVEQVG